MQIRRTSNKFLLILFVGFFVSFCQSKARIVTSQTSNKEQENLLEQYQNKNSDPHGKILLEETKEIKSRTKRNALQICCSFCKYYSCSVFTMKSLNWFKCYICHRDRFCHNSVMSRHC